MLNPYHHRRSLYAFSVALLVCVVGCGGGNSAGDATTSSVVASAEVTAAYTADDEIQAAATFFVTTHDPVACLLQLWRLKAEASKIEAVEKGLTGDDFMRFWRRVQVPAEEYSAALSQSASDLAAYDWPDGVQEYVDSLVQSQFLEAASYLEWSNIRIYEDLFAYEWPELNLNDEVMIRAKLGLEPVTADTNYCESISD